MRSDKFHWLRWVGALLVVTGCALPVPSARAQESAAEGSSAVQPAPSDPARVSPFNEQRILGVIPDYQTVRDSRRVVPPLTVAEKWTLVFKESADPFNLFTAAAGAGISQAAHETPDYGQGGAAFARRFGAAVGDCTLQNVFGAGLLPTLLHQDPRYFRKGPASGVRARLWWAASRIVIARQDSGAPAFNASEVFGVMLGIAASNLYYPAASRRGSVMVGRLKSSFLGDIASNLLSEFWPDLQKKFLHRRHQESSAGESFSRR